MTLLICSQPNIKKIAVLPICPGHLDGGCDDCVIHRHNPDYACNRKNRLVMMPKRMGSPSQIGRYCRAVLCVAHGQDHHGHDCHGHDHRGHADHGRGPSPPQI